MFQAAAAEGGQLSEKSDEELAELAAKAVEEAVAADARKLYQDSAKNRWIVKKLTRIVTRSILVMAEQLRRGAYRPSAEELQFSSAETPGSTPELSGGSMRLRGKIDRVDTAEHAGQLYVKIVDYKTGATSWEPYRILSGSQLQLLVYLSAVTELFERQYPGKQILPGASTIANMVSTLILMPSGLMNSDETALSLLAGEGEDAGSFLPLKLSDGKIRLGENTVSAERFLKLQAYAKEKLKEAGEAILGGDVRALPLEEDGKSSCEYCPHRDVCAFDAKITGYRVRQNKKRKAEEVFAEMDAALNEEVGE